MQKSLSALLGQSTINCIDAFKFTSIFSFRSDIFWVNIMSLYFISSLWSRRNISFSKLPFKSVWHSSWDISLIICHNNFLISHLIFYLVYFLLGDNITLFNFLKRIFESFDFVGYFFCFTMTSFWTMYWCFWLSQSRIELCSNLI